MKNVLLMLALMLTFSTAWAHEGGHGAPSRIWIINNSPLVAELIKYDQQKVVLMDVNHQVQEFELSELTPRDQALVLEQYQYIAALHQGSASYIVINKYKLLGLAGLGVILFVVLTLLFRKRKKIYWASSALGGMVLVFFACDKSTPSDLPAVPANEVADLTALFGNFSKVTTSSDGEWFYISSDGLPEHNMMVGITNWQQQVPVKQNYTGNNSWAIPLQPELAEEPLSTQTNLLRGAIAIAANGIPIFNPLNNRGEDANDIGELDQWGGHCGRADDYHYHLPPTHLQSAVGAGQPIAYALDGFPIYGTTTEELDEYLGRFNDEGGYQYHTIADYPYFIAGMRGKVELDPRTSAPENQITPQARTEEIRPALTPLQGAEIVNFVNNGNNYYSLTYTRNNQNYIINYSWDQNEVYTYEFVNPDGTSTVETYQR